MNIKAKKIFLTASIIMGHSTFLAKADSFNFSTTYRARTSHSCTGYSCSGTRSTLNKINREAAARAAKLTETPKTANKVTQALRIIKLTQALKANLVAENPVIPIMQTIEILSSRNLTCHDSYDCRILPVGSSPCGGPTDYIIASRLHGDFFIMYNLANISLWLEEEFHHENDTPKDCAILPEPEVKCIINRCVELSKN